MSDNFERFDAAEYLDSPEAIQHYIDEASATGNAEFIAHSLGIVARAQGMSQLAKTTGLSRESLYRALSDRGNPNLKTLLAVANALNVRINIGASIMAK